MRKPRGLNAARLSLWLARPQMSEPMTDSSAVYRRFLKDLVREGFERAVIVGLTDKAALVLSTAHEVGMKIVGLHADDRKLQTTELILDCRLPGLKPLPIPPGR